MSILLKNAMILSSASILRALGTMVIGILLARYLGPVKLGEYQLLVTTITLWATFGGLSVGRSIVYYASREIDRQDAFLATGIYLGIILSILSSIGFALSYILGKSYFSKYADNIAIICSISVFFMLLQSVLRPMLLLKNKIGILSGVISIAPYLQLLGISVLIIFHLLSVYMALVVAFAAQLLIFYVSFRSIFNGVRINNKLEWSYSLSVLVHGIRLHITNVLLFLDKKLAILFMPLIFPQELSAVGYFSRAVAICSIFQLSLGFVYDLIYNDWLRIKSNSRVNQAQRIVRILLSFGTILGIVIYIFSESIIVSLYGDDYLQAVPILKILIFQQVIWSVSRIFQSLYASEGAPQKSNMGLMFMLMVEVPLVFVMSQYYGLQGVAMALLLSQLVLLLVNIYMLGKDARGDIRKWFLLEYEDIEYIKTNLIRTIRGK